MCRLLGVKMIITVISSEPLITQRLKKGCWLEHNVRMTPTLACNALTMAIWQRGGRLYIQAGPLNAQVINTENHSRVVNVLGV